MKIAVTGYYGFFNFGDELFIIASKLGADSYWKEHELLFVSPPIKGSDAAFIVPRWFPAEAYAQMGLLGKISRMLFLVTALIKTDAVLNAGGSTISSASSDSKFKVQLLMRRWFKKKLLGIGLSLGPFRSDADRASAQALLEQFDTLALRDERSCDLASELLPNKGVGCATDLVGVVAQHYRFDEIKKVSDVIGVSLMQFDDAYKDVNGHIIDIDRSMKTFAQFATEHKMRVRVFVLNMHPVNGDNEISETFMNMLEDSSVEYEKISLDIGAVPVWEKIAECSMMVSYRLHGAIAAYLAGVPFHLVEYHQKCTDLLDDIGHQKSQHPDSLTSFLSGPKPSAQSHERYMRSAKMNFLNPYTIVDHSDEDS